MSAPLPLLAVVHDFGSVSPVDVLMSARKLCDVVFVCDRTALDAGVADLARVCDVTGLGPSEVERMVADLRPDGVITFSEYQLRTSAALAAALGLPHLSPRVAAVLTDKFRQRTVLRDAGVDATRCRVVHRLDELPAALADVGLPAVLKPRHGAGSTDTCQVDSAAEAEEALRRFLPTGKEFVVEELLRGDPTVVGPAWGDYVSVESVVAGGTVRHVCVTGRLPLAPPFRESGMFIPAALDAGWTARVEDLAEAAIRALGVTDSVTHTEIKLTPDGPRVIEVNGRAGGYVSVTLRSAARFDLLGAAIRVALGHDPAIGELEFRQVAYQRQLVAPRDATTLVDVGDVDRIRAVPGVRDVTVTGVPGQALHWRDGTMGCVGVVSGAAADHRELAERIAMIDSSWQPEFTP